MHHVRRPILRFVVRVVSRPRLTLAVTLVATAACVGLAVGRLRISTDQEKLFSRDVPFFRDYANFGRAFPENDGIYVVVQPRDPKARPAVERWAGAAEAIAGRLRGLSQHVKSVAVRVPPDEMGRQALLFEEPSELRAEV